MSKSKATAPPTPPPPQYLPRPPSHWLEKIKNEKTDTIFCCECENIFYIYDEKNKCIRQFLYQCDCDL